MNILLLNPPTPGSIVMVREGRCMQRKDAWTTVWPPVTLATIAALLRNEGHTVTVHDCDVEGMRLPRLKELLAREKPDAVVLNTATASIVSDLACARAVKQLLPQCLTIAIGLHVTALPEESLAMEPALDCLVRGEPEETVAEILRCRTAHTPFSMVRGISWRDHDAIRHAPARGFTTDLSRLPFPAWDLIDTKRYRIPLQGEPFLLVTTSKGCPHECIFCPAKPYYGSRLRLKDPVRVVDEMREARSRYGVRNFLFWSESFTADRRYVELLCFALLKANIGARWACNSRVDNVDPALLRLMRSAGCWMVAYGVESGCQELLDAARKKISVAQSEQAAAWARAAGLAVTVHVVFGLPGETMASGQRTIRWMRALEAEFAQCYCAVPWPSAPLYALARAKGWLTDERWERFEQNCSVLRTDTLTPGDVERLRRAALRSFYSSPGRMIRIARLAGWRNWLRLAGTAREFAQWA